MSVELEHRYIGDQSDDLCTCGLNDRQPYSAQPALDRWLQNHYAPMVKAEALREAAMRLEHDFGFSKGHTRLGVATQYLLWFADEFDPAPGNDDSEGEA